MLNVRLDETPKSIENSMKAVRLQSALTTSNHEATSSCYRLSLPVVVYSSDHSVYLEWLHVYNTRDIIIK